ncbi:hypothetical protein GCM10023084_39740 [Streptomyces lacrimifluminis]|uniref:Uncharacterized protein n=1 Tax=Streptomyces lacrimifluminis TaxID=1500077 RepID=A0A917L1L4_9ACTN|nr:hypothetical protein GCM10012282_41360 [Streptomyces lacrimifluminis]
MTQWYVLSGAEWRRVAPSGMAHFLPLLFSHSRILMVPHSDTGPRVRRGSATVRSIMRFGLLLLSCRGEGL